MKIDLDEICKKAGIILTPIREEKLDEMLENHNKHYVNYFDFSRIPERLMQNMVNYVQHGELLGGFLEAVFANDLFAATARADSECLKILPTFVKWIYNEAPHTCHGSYEIVKNWYIKKDLERKQNEQ